MNTLDRIAHDKAFAALQRGFDGEAYLVLCESEKRLKSEDKPSQPKQQDLVPESKVDENIQSLQDDFIRYMMVKKLYRAGQASEDVLMEHLNKFLSYLRKIVTEVYASADTIEEKKGIAEFKRTLDNIMK